MLFPFVLPIPPAQWLPSCQPFSTGLQVRIKRFEGQSRSSQVQARVNGLDGLDGSFNVVQ